MALDIVATCSATASTSEAPGLALFLIILFSVYIALDSLLAALVIGRKIAEAEKRGGGG